MKAFWKSMRLLGLGLLAALLVSCGGETTGQATTQTRTLASVNALVAAPLSVTGLEKISETRVGRTTYDYAFRLTVKNSGPAQGGVRVTMVSVGQGGTIVKGTIDVGSVPANATVKPLEMVVIRQDRNYPFKPENVIFNVTSTGPEEPPTGTQKAEATLLPGVRLLSEVEAGAITASTYTTLTFSRDLALVPGTVFIVNGTAYKSLASSAGASGTVVTVGAPAIEEIFSRVEIRGKYVVSDAEVVAESALTAGRTSLATRQATATATVTDTVPISVGPLKGSSTLTGSLSVDADYLYDKALGGLQSATLTATLNVSDTINLNMQSGGNVFKFFIKGKSYFIPIRLTLYDALLNAVGFNVAGIFIPTGLAVSSDTKFQATGTITGSFSGTATASYANGASTAAFVPTGSVNVSVPTVSGLASVERKIDTGVYLNLRPALSALNKVALAGVDLKLGPRFELTATETIGGTPPYCLTIEGFAHAEANFYFKTIGTSKTSDVKEFEQSVFSKPLLGTCLSPTTVQIVATKATSTPALFGEPIDVSFTVQPQPGHTVPGKVPSGEVTVSAGSKSCKAMLQANGSGHCSLTPDQAGAAVRLDVSYAGDTVYAGSTGAAPVFIDKSRSFVTLSASPTTVTTNSSVAFNVILSPLPDLLQKLPTGTVDIRTANGELLCTATLNASGTGTCNAVLAKAGIVVATADYGGDSNYLTSSSTPVSITVNASTNLVSATLLVPDLQQNWTGLPATIQFTMLTVVNKTSFQIFGNSATCGTGERGSPLYSAAVPAGAVFYAAATTTGVPYTSSGPGVNRRNCSSFVAVLMVPNPANPLQEKPRIWMNGTGRGQQFIGGGPTFDWESQVRFDSGDPWTGVGKSCVGGTVANAGFFGAAWSSPNCSATLTY